MALLFVIPTVKGGCVEGEGKKKEARTPTKMRSPFILLTRNSQ